MRRSSLAFTVLTLAALGCAPKDNGTITKADSAAPVAVAAQAPAAPNVVTVHASEFAYQQAPDSIPAGMTTFHLVNDGKTPHHLVLVRLDSGKTLTEFEKELAKPAPPPAWAAFEGGPNAADPGKTVNATLDLTPGSYAMLCFVDMPGGVPHFAKGMIKPFTVTAAKGPAAAAPKSDVSIKLSDYNFDVSKPIAAGNHTFEVTNAGPQVHEVQLVRLAPGKTVQDLLDFIQKPAGAPPGELVGGVAPTRNTTNYFSADLAAGNYAFICFVPDAKDGKPHFTHGMTKTFTIS